MLSYAYEKLIFKEYDKVASEDFENIYELFSKILIVALNKQIKQGLYRDYIEIDETTSSIRGKINITESINECSFIYQKLNCTYDDFSMNSYLNKIIKTTLMIILKQPLANNLRHGIKNILFYFRDVDTLNPNTINWQIRYDRNNQEYRLIIGICYLTIKGLLQSDKKGNMKLMKFFDDDHMNILYEKFILNFYKKEYPFLTAGWKEVNWQLDPESDEKMLPRMTTDIPLEFEGKILIIDAKYYSNTTTDSDKVHSHNLYQIFTYVKNKSYEVGEDVNVSGMLLYARTADEKQPEQKYKMIGNEIYVRTLNLNQDFEYIKKDLKEIVQDYFDVD